MIITEEVKIKTTNKNITYYKSLGFNIKSGDVVIINPIQLSKGSHENISVCCDVCKSEKNMGYKTYYYLTKGLKEKYYCNKCKVIKYQKTCLEKYGVENTFQIEEIKQQNKKVDKNYSKQKETFLKKYNVTSYLKLLPNNHDKNHEKMKETIKNKYSLFFIEKSKEIHGNIFEYMSPYENMSIKMEIYCKLCHHTFYQKPKDHIHNKQGCPICKISKGEKEIKNYLELNNIKYEQQKTFDGCKYIKSLKFDFYLPYFNTVIEYNGEQHYKSFEYFGGEKNFKKVQKRDMIKQNYCKEKKITFIIIKYDENINEILNQSNIKNINKIIN